MYSARRLPFAILMLIGCARLCAARTAVPDLVVPENMRSIDGGRKVLIVMQAVEPANDDPLAVSFARGQAPLSELSIRDEFSSLMPARLAAVVNLVPWLGARDIETSGDSTWSGIETALDASNTRQMLVLRIEHSLSADFKTTRVWLRALLLNRQIPPGKTSRARLTQDWTPYQLDFTVWLSPPGAAAASRDENRRAWAANDGALARRAIGFSVDWIAARFAQTLAEDVKQSATWRNRGNRNGTQPDGTPGWILEQEQKGFACFESRRRSLTYRGTLTP
jgi:hypothetical protein